MTPLLRRPLSRRTVLRGLGGVAIALPFLEVMQARAEGAPPKRLILLFSANGTVPGAWAPTGGETDFTFSPILEPLAPHRKKLLVLGNVDLKVAFDSPGIAHQRGIGTLWTGRKLDDSHLFGLAGWGIGPSIDQVVAQAIGGATRFGSLELGVQVSDDTVAARMCYAGPAQPLPPLVDPRAVFDRLFGSFDADPKVAAARRAHRKSVLDAVRAEFAAISKRVSVDDRRKLDAHATAIRDLEQRLDVVFEPGPACAKPDEPPPLPLSDPASFPAITELHLDLLTMALTCDLTRVVSLQWSQAASPTVFSWLGLTDLHHELSHRSDSDAPAQAALIAIHRWYAEQVAALLTRLDSVQEGDGTLLDHSLVVWGNEMGHGNDHSYLSTPFVLAGSAGGIFKTGRYLDRAHQSHNDLLVTCLNAFGVPVNTFGDPAYCSGPMSGLTT